MQALNFMFFCTFRSQNFNAEFKNHWGGWRMGEFKVSMLKIKFSTQSRTIYVALKLQFVT